VIIRSFLADQRAYPSQGPIELPKGVRSVRIDYTALSLGEPERMRFRYKLEGADDIWRDAGAERSVRYATLRPGRYRFQVIASNGDGVWNGAGATVAFVLPRAFYQTTWFYALIVGTCLGAVWLLLLARLRQITHRERKRLEQRLEDRLNERTRIARELHDSLLQGFQGLIFRLQAVRELLPERPGAAAESLDTALQAGDQAICEGRDAVQNLRSATFEDGDLATAVGALGAELGSSVEPQPTPEYRVMVEGTPYELNPHVRDDIYSVVREAVRNAYQHARATRIETDITFEDTDLRIRVRDDGIGVDPEILALGRRPDHWGLPGMRERCESPKRGESFERRCHETYAHECAEGYRVDLFVRPARGLRRGAFQEHPGVVFSVLDGVRPGGHRIGPRGASGAEGHRAARGVAGAAGRPAGLRVRGQLRDVVDLARLMRLT
jgi:signal transduction histidine kinase